MSKIVEIVDRKPIEWADMNADEFERDIEILQEFCRYYIKHESIGLREIKGKNEFISLLEQEHCAGALIFLEREDRPNQMMRWMERLGAYDRRKLKMDCENLIRNEDY